MELIKAAPKTVLNAFFLPKDAKTVGQTLRFHSGREDHPLNYIETAVLVEWANEGPKNRFPTLARATPIFIEYDDDTDTKLSPIALALINAAPDKNVVLYEMRKNLSNVAGTWSPLSEVFDKRRLALEPLKKHSNIIIAQRALDWDKTLTESAEQDRLFKRDEDERFE